MIEKAENGEAGNRFPVSPVGCHPTSRSGPPSRVFSLYRNNLGGACSVPEYLGAVWASCNHYHLKRHHEQGSIPDHCQAAWSAKASGRRLKHQLGPGEWVCLSCLLQKMWEGLSGWVEKMSQSSGIGIHIRYVGNNESTESDASNCVLCL